MTKDISDLDDFDRSEYAEMEDFSSSKTVADNLFILARDKEEFIRKSLAGNSSISDEIKEILAEDESHKVIKNLLDFQFNILESIQLKILQTDNIPVLASLAERDDLDSVN